ncbi:tetratricopeptide repeat protein [Patescibacteria group bacterium]
MKKISTKGIITILSIIILLIAGGVWVNNTYFTDQPEQPTIVTKVDRGISEEDMPIFQERIDDLIQQIAKSEKRDINLILQLGNMYYSVGELALSLEKYNDILSTDPDDGPALENKGQTLFEMGSLVEAEEVWRKALSIDNNERTYLKVAALLDENYPERKNELLSFLEDAVSTIGQTPGLMVALGNWHRNNGDLDAAISHYDVASKLAPDDAGIKAELELLKKQRSDQAQKSMPTEDRR